MGIRSYLGDYLTTNHWCPIIKARHVFAWATRFFFWLLFLCHIFKLFYFTLLPWDNRMPLWQLNIYTLSLWRSSQTRDGRENTGCARVKWDPFAFVPRDFVDGVLFHNCCVSLGENHSRRSPYINLKSHNIQLWSSDTLVVICLELYYSYRRIQHAMKSKDREHIHTIIQFWLTLLENPNIQLR